MIETIVNGNRITVEETDDEISVKKVYVHDVNPENGDVVLMSYVEWDRDGVYWERSNRGYTNGGGKVGDYDAGINTIKARDVMISLEVRAALLEKAKELTK